MAGSLRLVAYSPAMARIIPLVDLVFLLIDRPETPANVGVLMQFDPPAGRSATSVVGEILRSYRKAVPSAPFDCIPDMQGLGLPQWQTVPKIDLRYHVRKEVLAEPGGDAELNELVSELHREPLDRSRPLFRIHLIEGLASGRFALYLKSHHASWDGRSALHRVFGSLGTEPGPLKPPFFAGEGSSTGVLPTAADTMRWVMAQALGLRELLPALASRTNRPADLLPKVIGNQPFAGPQTRFNLPLTAERSFAGFSLPIAEMREVAAAFDAKLNDVVLGVVDAGLERYLAALKERPGKPLVAMCPVSLRDPGDLETTTKVATLFVPLAKPRVAIAERMRQIAANTVAAKRELGVLSNEAKIDFALLAFGLWWGAHALGLDAFTRPVINVVISNVGGLPEPHYLGRSRLVAAYPVSMLADPVGLNVTTLSGDGRMDFGIVANYAAVPDAAEIAAHCVAAFESLRRQRPKAARGAARKRPARRRTAARVRS